MTTFFIGAVVLIAIAMWLFRSRAANSVGGEGTEFDLNLYRKKLQKIAASSKRSSFGEVIAGLRHYAKNADVFFKKSKSLGMTPNKVREFVLKSMEEKSVCGAFIVDIPVDLYVKFYSEITQTWNFSSSNNEFNRLYRSVREEFSSEFSLGCTLIEQANSGGALDILLSCCIPVPSHMSLEDAPKKGRLHADLYAVSEDLKIRAEYETVATKTIPFAIFVYNKNYMGYDDDLGYEQDADAPEAQDPCKIFLLTIPLTLLNPLYKESKQYIDIIEKNLQFKG